MYLDDDDEYLYTLNSSCNWGDMIKIDVDGQYKL